MLRASRENACASLDWLIPSISSLTGKWRTRPLPRYLHLLSLSLFTPPSPFFTSDISTTLSLSYVEQFFFFFYRSLSIFPLGTPLDQDLVPVGESIKGNLSIYLPVEKTSPFSRVCLQPSNTYQTISKDIIIILNVSLSLAFTNTSHAQ